MKKVVKTRRDSIDSNGTSTSTGSHWIYPPAVRQHFSSPTKMEPHFFVFGDPLFAAIASWGVWGSRSKQALVHLGWTTCWKYMGLTTQKVGVAQSYYILYIDIIRQCTILSGYSITSTLHYILPHFFVEPQYSWKVPAVAKIFGRKNLARLGFFNKFSRWAVQDWTGKVSKSGTPWRIHGKNGTFTYMNSRFFMVFMYR